MKQTFVEKILQGEIGDIVFRKPNLVLSGNSTSEIISIFETIGATEIHDASQLLIAFDLDISTGIGKSMGQLVQARSFLQKHQVTNFYDLGSGSLNHLVSKHIHPGNIVLGVDSYSNTAGAYNAFATSIDQLEAATIWSLGETWLRVSETIKITLVGELQTGIYAKDLAMYILNSIGRDGANYLSMEFHGSGVSSLSLADRVTIANISYEVGAKNAAFPPDEVLAAHYGLSTIEGIWADEDAQYAIEFTIDLGKVPSLLGLPYNKGGIVPLKTQTHIPVGIGYVGATSSGRIEDLRIVRSILQGKKVKSSFQLFVVPASQGVFRQAYTEGIIQDITEAGAIVLPPTDSSSAILAEIASNTNTATITSSNLGYVDFLANRIANIYIAAPANVALSALKGTISCLDEALDSNDTAYIPSRWPQLGTVENDRLSNGVWNYTDFNNISSSKIFSSLHSAHVNSPITIRPYLFEDFDTLFATKVSPTDIILAGDNFGCGVLKEQSITGLVYAGVKAIVAKSFSSLFYRSAINHGLFVIEHAQAIDSYQSGLKVSLDFENNEILVGLAPFDFRSFPNEILEILHAKGLINWTKQKIANKKLSSVNQ